MAQNCFLHEKYNDVILIYLCKFFQGPTKQMAAIWKAAREFEIDTFDLEERIITQMLIQQIMWMRSNGFMTVILPGVEGN